MTATTDRPGGRPGPGRGPSGRAAGADPFTARRRRRSRRAALPALVLLVLGLLAGLAGWLGYGTDLVAIREVRVTGTVRLAPEAVRRAAQVPMGTPLPRLRPGEVAERVTSALPAAREVRVGRRWPHTVTLSVTERTATVALRTPAGIGLMDDAGIVFARVGRVPVGVPVLETASPGRRDPATLAGLQVLTGLPADLRGSVFTVVAPSPDEISLRLRGGAAVLWGSTEEARPKADVLRVLLRQPAATYDVSSPDVVTTRGTPAPAPKG